MTKKAMTRGRMEVGGCRGYEWRRADARRGQSLLHDLDVRVVAVVVDWSYSPLLSKNISSSSRSSSSRSSSISSNRSSSQLYLD